MVQVVGRGMVARQCKLQMYFTEVPWFVCQELRWQFARISFQIGMSLTSRIGVFTGIHRHSTEVAWWRRNNLLITIKLKNNCIFKIFWLCVLKLLEHHNRLWIVQIGPHIPDLLEKKLILCKRFFLNVEFTLKTFVVSG
jgi:hypothetical protein